MFLVLSKMFQGRRNPCFIDFRICCKYIKGQYLGYHSPPSFVNKQNKQLGKILSDKDDVPKDPGGCECKSYSIWL